MHRVASSLPWFWCSLLKPEQAILILLVPATVELGYNSITSKVSARYNRIILRQNPRNWVPEFQQ
jgi:hypothetical protein